jgi:hypothetical protein
MSISNWLSSFTLSPAEVRAEVWRLGVRHHGEPLQGALAELKGRGLAPARVALLHACVRSMKQAYPPPVR